MASIYLSDSVLQQVLKTYSLDTASGERTALPLEAIEQILLEVDSEIEGKLCGRYIVPLQANNGGYDLVPSFTRNKVVVAAKAMVRMVLVRDYGVNSDATDSSHIQSTNRKVFDSHMKDLDSSRKNFGLKLQSYAEESGTPVETIGLARYDSTFEVS